MLSPCWFHLGYWLLLHGIQFPNRHSSLQYEHYHLVPLANIVLSQYHRHVLLFGACYHRYKDHLHHIRMHNEDEDPNIARHWVKRYDFNVIGICTYIVFIMLRVNWFDWCSWNCFYQANWGCGQFWNWRYNAMGISACKEQKK